MSTPQDFGVDSRPPTCAIPWPTILVEGPEKAGKTYWAAEFTADERIGRAFWLDMGEGAGDEYGAIPGANYEILRHDGSWPSIMRQIRAVRAYAASIDTRAGEKPVVLIIDTANAIWQLLKDEAQVRALDTKWAKKKLESDPDVEIRPDNRLWNEANAKHRGLMDLLCTFNGIVILTGRGKEVSAIGADGRPVEGEKEWRVETQKSLPYDVTAWVRLDREAPTKLVGVRSLHAGIRPGRDKAQVRPGLTAAQLIFDVMKCDPANAEIRDLKVTTEATLLQIGVAPTVDELRAIYLEYTAQHGRRLEVERATKERKKVLAAQEAASKSETSTDSSVLAGMASEAADAAEAADRESGVA